MSEKHLDVVFLKLDCNQENKVFQYSSPPFVNLLFAGVFLSLLCCLQPLAKELGIKVVPTFKILKDSKVVKEVTGAKLDDLVAAIETVKSS